MTAMLPCSLDLMNKHYICPVCGETAIKHQNAIGADWKLLMNKRNPVPGDLSICVHCAEILVFDEAMDLVMPTIDQLLHLSPFQNDMIEAAQKRVKSGTPMVKPECKKRVGAILKAELSSGVCYFIGYGIYEADEVPPPDINPQLNLGVPNPKLIMDDGQVVWGCECWWGPEDDIRDMVNRFKKVIPVNMQTERAKLNEKPSKDRKDSQGPDGQDSSSTDSGTGGWKWKK